MSKYLLSAAAAAFLMVGASSGAMADAAACNDAFGPLPSAGWSWQAVPSGGGFTFDSRSAGASDNVFADVYESSPSITCNAVNPGQNIVASKGGVIELNAPPELVASNVKVCDKDGQTTAGVDYGYDCG